MNYVINLSLFLLIIFLYNLHNDDHSIQRDYIREYTLGELEHKSTRILHLEKELVKHAQELYKIRKENVRYRIMYDPSIGAMSHEEVTNFVYAPVGEVPNVYGD